jgi:hypothetical protein
VGSDLLREPPAYIAVEIPAVKIAMLISYKLLHAHLLTFAHSGNI